MFSLHQCHVSIYVQALTEGQPMQATARQMETRMALRIHQPDETDGTTIGDVMPTLSELANGPFRKLWIEGNGLDAKTFELYGHAIAWWKRLTGDPPVDLIDDDLIAEFVAGLRKQPGRKWTADPVSGARVKATMSSFTVAKHCKALDKVLRFAGPKARTDEDYKNLELLARPPKIKAPRVDQQPPDGDFTVDEIVAILNKGCPQMTRPVVDNVTPPDWWRSIVTAAVYLGLRRADLLAAEFPGIVNGELIIPAEKRKRRKGIRQPIHAVAMRAIESIRTGRVLIWPWPYKGKWRLRELDKQLKRLVTFSEIDPRRRFAWNGFRKCHETQVADAGGDAESGIRLAQASAGHGSPDVAKAFYVNGNTQRNLKRRAIDQLPDITGGNRQQKLFD